MDNYYDRQKEIARGERSQLDPPERTPEPEPEYVKCDGCGKDMEFKEHYINGGLCFSCISEIGK